MNDRFVHMSDCDQSGLNQKSRINLVQFITQTSAVTVTSRRRTKTHTHRTEARTTCRPRQLSEIVRNIHSNEEFFIIYHCFKRLLKCFIRDFLPPKMATLANMDSAQVATGATFMAFIANRCSLLHLKTGHSNNTVCST